LLSSLCEITELKKPAPLAVARLHQPVPVLRLNPQVPTRPLPLPDDGDDVDEERPTSSSTRSLPRDPRPPSHRWPPALRG
jgi:hypothetical protein